MLLKLGMQGPDVANVERVVAALGFGEITTGGIFDAHLQNVIKYIQKSHNLTVDGVVGDQTLDLLDSLYEPGVHNFSSSTNVPEDQWPDVIGNDDHIIGILALVHPVLARKCIQITNFAKDEGYLLRVTQGLRTFPEQHKLFLQRPRVTKADAGQSYHNYGLAVDFAFVTDGKLDWTDKLYSNVGRWAGRVGLEWGGNWHFVDRPHVQLHSLPATSKLLAVYNMAPGDQNAKLRIVWNKFVGGA